MLLKVDHMAIAVKDMESAKSRVAGLGGEFVVEQVNEKAKYKVAIFVLGELCVTLLAATEPDSFVAKHLEKNGESIQHIGIEVDDLDQTIKELAEKGIKATNYEELGTRKEALLSPKYLFGYILQLIEWVGETKELSQKERMVKTWLNKQ
jgi:methylmalonyl-CoA epimerase